MTLEEAMRVLKKDRDLCMFNPTTGEREPMNEDCRESAKAYDVILSTLENIGIEVVRCKDCKHRPISYGTDHDLEFPDDLCPCQIQEDFWYSWMPADDRFCANGEKAEQEDRLK